MKKYSIIITLALATVIVAAGSRYSMRVVVDPASYTLPVDPNDPIVVVLAPTHDPNAYALWQSRFGDNERTTLFYEVSYNRERGDNLARTLMARLRALEARVAALEPVVDPNGPPAMPEIVP